MFIHHPDNLIIVNGVSIPLSVFLLLEPDYEGLPEGNISRIYNPNVKHSVSTGSLETPLPLQWENGDNYIEKSSLYSDWINVTCGLSSDTIVADGISETLLTVNLTSGYTYNLRIGVKPIGGNEAVATFENVSSGVFEYGISTQTLGLHKVTIQKQLSELPEVIGYYVLAFEGV